MGNRSEMSAEMQSLKDKLSAIILLEISKPYEKIDSDLVDECVDFLMELDGKERLSKSEIKERINNIPFKGRVTALGTDVKKKVRAKRLALIAAVFALIIAIFSIFTLASEDFFGDLLYKMGHKLMEIMDERTLEYGNISMYNDDESRVYETVDEFVEAEGISILYPTWFPNEEKVAMLMYSREGEAEHYTISCTEPMHSIGVYPGEPIHESMKQDCRMKEISGYEVYYFVLENRAQGNFVYKDYQYAVGADTEENLFKIIENLEEIN